MVKRGTKRNTPKKCLQTVCGNTCIKSSYKCRDKDPKAKANIKQKTKNLVQNLGNRAWVAKGIATNRTKATVKNLGNSATVKNLGNRAWVAKGIATNRTKAAINRIKERQNLLKDRTWVNANITRRKFSTGMKQVLSKVVSAIKKVESLPEVLKREGVAGVKNRTWLATAQSKAGIKRAVNNAATPVRKAFNDLANNVWYAQNKNRYQFS